MDSNIEHKIELIVDIWRTIKAREPEMPKETVQALTATIYIDVGKDSRVPKDRFKPKESKGW